MTAPRIQIDDRGPFADGHAFDGTGPYERLTGRVHFAVDPQHPAYAAVVDLDKAPRNAGGLVEFASDLCILAPADPARGNGRLLFGYGNRGNKRELQFFNDAPPGNDPRTLADAGNGFLMRRGYTVVWAAWEGDLLPGNGRMVLDVPVAGDGGAPITGRVRSEFIANAARPPRAPTPPRRWTRARRRSPGAATRVTRRSRWTRRGGPSRAWSPGAGWTGRARSSRWCRRTATSTCRRASSRAGSTSWCTPGASRA